MNGKKILFGVVGFYVGVSVIEHVRHRAAVNKAWVEMRDKSVTSLRAELLAWTLLAPQRGYTEEEIKEYVSTQKEFIEQVERL